MVIINRSNNCNIIIIKGDVFYMLTQNLWPMLYNTRNCTYEDNGLINLLTNGITPQ